MIDLPRNLIDADGLEEINDVLTAIIMRIAAAILAHEDDRHVRKELRELLPCLDEARRVHGHGLLDSDDGKGHALFDDDSAMDIHGETPF